MAVDRSVIGTVTGRRRVVIERGPVAVFAEAVGDTAAVYRDATAAAEAGYPAIPVPPTFPVAMTNWGAFSEMQPRAEPGEEGEGAVGRVLGPLLAEGGLLLHGEEEVEYRRPVHVGDVLTGEGRVADVYEKESSTSRMTFVVTETVWKDDSSGEVAVVTRTNVLVRRPRSDTRGEDGADR